MPNFLYEGHLGTLYVLEEFEENMNNLFCETCGDSDWFVGKFDTTQEFWNLMKDKISIEGSGGWSLQYVFPWMVRHFELPCKVTYEARDDYLTGYCSNSDEDILKQLEPYITPDGCEVSFVKFVERIRNKEEYCDQALECEECCLSVCYDCEQNKITKSKS